MPTLLPRAALLLALILCACDRKSGAVAPAAGGPLLPNYIDRGIVVRDPNPQRPNFWDFDVVAYGERPKHVFRLQNLDPDPVTIRNMLPSCGCLLVALRSPDGKQSIQGILTEDAAPFVIPSHGEAELELTIDTSVVEKMNLDKLVYVRLVCDSKTTPYLAFELHLKVQREFRCVPNLIDLGEIPQSYSKRASGTVSTESARSRAQILGLERVDGPFEVKVDETKLGEERVWMVVVDAKEDLPLGPARGRVVLKTSSSDGTGTGPLFEVPISGQVVPRIVARPAAVHMSLVKDSATIDLECLVPGEKVELKKVRFEGPGPDFVGTFAAETLDGARAVKWRVKLQLSAAGATGGFTRTAVLELDDPKMPELRVPVTVDTQ
jgi:hypothetical protein